LGSKYEATPRCGEKYDKKYLMMEQLRTLGKDELKVKVECRQAVNP
jgi:hypothetical protein